ncbi:hypothetical protein E4O73_02490 [Neisseria meningitidis]|nr:hypothetical protein [Neisseria meningitidis]MBG8651247.1 hypothetical protein [Neisseria meningitidis]MBG8676001.1 hypothetical protein [Neisseria meningitidis]MBG8714077.1 hypothetical protein [Neisseria meningitidis]MBG8725055.1 hypothetical protein [Neisseria meningitidis]
MPSFPRKRESGSFGFVFFEFRATSASSFPRRWESRSVRTGTYAPSFPRKRESRFFGTETYRIKRFL